MSLTKHQHQIANPEQYAGDPVVQADASDMADAEQRFEKKYAAMLGDSWREEVARKTRECFDRDPHCGVCQEKIEDVSLAGLFEPVNAKPFILCTREECHVKAITGSVDRYMGKPRRNVA